MTQIEKFIQAALSQLDAPYIWGGKGDKQFFPKSGSYTRHNFGVNVFDCSGLIMWAGWQAGGDDMRGDVSTKTMLDTFNPALDQWEPGVLRLYPRHVSLVISTGVIIEAAGGGEGTLVFTPGACVRKGLERRKDFIAARHMKFNR